METAFEIIAEPSRRAILSLLVLSEQSVGEIERQLRMSQPTVSKHLRVLRDAGFVESTVDAQRRLYRLKSGAVSGTRCLARAVPPLLVGSHRCSRTPPRPDASVAPKPKPKEKRRGLTASQ